MNLRQYTSRIPNSRPGQRLQLARRAAVYRPLPLERQNLTSRQRLALCHSCQRPAHVRAGCSGTGRSLARSGRPTCRTKGWADGRQPPGSMQGRARRLSKTRPSPHVFERSTRPRRATAGKARFSHLRSQCACGSALISSNMHDPNLQTRNRRNSMKNNTNFLYCET